MAETVITSEAPSTSSQLNPPSRLICHVCQKQFSQYTCPRCNTRYCSLECYKGHSLRCTESFMKENVMEEMQQLEPDDDAKQKMMGILGRFHTEVEADSMDEDDLILTEETIQKVLSGREISFDDLSPEEKRLFQREVASGRLSKFIEPWQPWWLNPSARTISISPEGAQLIQPLAEQDTEASLQSDQVHDIPLGPETPLPPVSKLISAEPSPLLGIHLVDIIYSYCFTLRLFNGDWQSNAIDAASVALSISCVLGQGEEPPETVAQALCHCFKQTCSPAFKYMGGLLYGLRVMHDVMSLLSLGHAALVCLLCDLQRLIRAAEKELKSEKLSKSKVEGTKSKLRFAERKVYFVMCWVYEQPGESWSSLATMVKVEKDSVMEIGGKERGTLGMESRGGKPLIKEIH